MADGIKDILKELHGYVLWAGEVRSITLIFHEMYNKTIIEFGFGDLRNYQGFSKCDESRLWLGREHLP